MTLQIDNNSAYLTLCIPFYIYIAKNSRQTGLYHKPLRPEHIPRLKHIAMLD